MKLITEDLIESIKDRTFAPVSQQTFQTARILSLVNQEMSTKLLPVLHSVREDFFLTSERRTIASGVSQYPVPERASGNSLKTITLMDSNQNKLSSLFKTQVNLIPSLIATGQPAGFFFAGDQFIVSPVPSQNYLADVWYFERPSELVETSACAKISSVSTLSGVTTFTVDTDQSASWTVGTLVDFLSAKSPFRLWAKDVAITAITASTVEVALTSVDTEAGTVGPVVGDYICLAQTCNYPMVPVEMHPVLAQLCAVRILRSMGDMNKTKDAEGELSSMMQATIKLITNRATTAPDIIVNSYSFLTAQSGVGAGRFGPFGS